MQLLVHLIDLSPLSPRLSSIFLAHELPHETAQVNHYLRLNQHSSFYGTPPSRRPRAYGVRFAPVPSGPASPPLRPLVQRREPATVTPGPRSTEVRSCRPATRSADGDRFAPVALGFCSARSPKKPGGPVRQTIERGGRILAARRERSPLSPVGGNLTPPSRSPSHQRGGSGGWPRGRPRWLKPFGGTPPVAKNHLSDASTPTTEK